MNNKEHQVLNKRLIMYKRQIWGYEAEIKLLKQQISEYFVISDDFQDAFGMSYTDFIVNQSRLKDLKYIITKTSTNIKELKRKIKECNRNYNNN